MMEDIKNQILSDAFQNMLQNYGTYVEAEVLAEKSRIYADGYFEAIEDVLKIIHEVRSDANKGFMFDMVNEIERRTLALKGECDDE